MTILILTDDIELSKAVFRYLSFHFGNEAEVYYSTYEEKDYIPSNVYKEADIFIFEVHRDYGDRGIRREGLYVALSLLRGGKKSLLISWNCNEELKKSRVYWSPGSEQSLKEKLRCLMESSLPDAGEYEKLKGYFYENYVKDHHHHRH